MRALRSTSAASFPALLLAVGCGDHVVGALPVDAGVDASVTSTTADAGIPDASAPMNAYPEGPYGAQIGDTLPNMEFAGYVTDGPAEGEITEVGYRESFTLQDLREREGFRYLLLNVAAEWCSGCRVEARQVPALYEDWGPRGGYVLSVITQDSSGRPATKRTLDSWVASFSLNYTMVHDPQQAVNRNLGPESLPMNVIVDLETMEILHRVIGEDFAVFDRFGGLLEAN